jgi:UDP-N-acetylmuramyl pentapeptide phosphotransferase/UDP-N-acetylglucosamine-1-phosphate transferase
VQLKKNIVSSKNKAMGGGLFGTPLYLNIKCLIFSAFIISIYYLPHPVGAAHNFVMVFLLGTTAYILLAWYDVLYDANDRLKPTLLGWLSKSFKPQEYRDEYDKLPLKTQKIIRMVDIGVLAIVFIAFIYPFMVKNPTTSIKRIRK